MVRPMPEHEQRASVLIVEDEAPQRELIADILRREGHPVHEAGNVEEALQAIDGELPDLVLSTGACRVVTVASSCARFAIEDWAAPSSS